ncbi:MAG: glycosyltransferase family 2 protein [Lachnospiraceae bacterium]|nr:glycosyltransferase family 2 protein [Lachnospiraceae bacterium]
MTQEENISLMRDFLEKELEASASDHNPLLSVVIAYYNTEKYLPECLASVYTALSGIPSEMILIDDLSTDGSHDLVEAFIDQKRKEAEQNVTEHNAKEQNATEAGSYPIRFVHLTVSTPSMGPGIAKNLGVNSARGKYIGFVDSDDMILPDMFRNMLSSIIYQEADLCVCDVSRYKNGKHTFAPLSGAAFSGIHTACTSLRDDPELIYSSIAPDKIFRRELLDRYQLRFDENCFYEDMFFVFRAYCVSAKIAVNRSIGYLWRVRDSRDPSITQNIIDEETITSFIASMARIMRYMNENGIDEAVQRTTKQRILRFSLGVYFSQLDSLSPERSVKFLSQWRQFITEYQVFCEDIPLSLYDRQRYQYLIAENYEAVIRLSVYKEKNYHNVPILNQDQNREPILKVKDEFFSITDRSAKNEFLLPTPPTFLKKIESEGDTLTLEGWLYCPRVNITDPQDQKMNCFLLNDITGDILPLDTVFAATPELTAKHSKVFNYDDYTTYQYNYDGCGVQARLNVQELLAQKEGPYLLMIEYENHLIRGYRVLRGLSQNVLGMLKTLTFSSEEKTLHLSTDPRSTLIFELLPKK